VVAQNFLDVEAFLLNFGVGAQDFLLSIFKYEDVCTVFDELELVSDQNDTLIFKDVFDTIVEYIVGYLGINCAKRVVQ
jgi:hypothetical protein